MPKVSKATASQTLAMEGFEGHYEKLEGGYTVGFESYGEDSDPPSCSRGCRTTAANPRIGATC